MNFYVYKLIDGVNNYYLYDVSRCESPDMQIEHEEHYACFFPDNLVNSYFDFIGWDNIEIQTVTDLQAVDFVSGNITADDKCMNLNDTYKSLIVEIPVSKKEKKQAKPKEQKEAKPKQNQNQEQRKQQRKNQKQLN